MKSPAVTGLLFSEPTYCGWCLEQLATTIVYATPACFTCAAGDSSTRVRAWLRAVEQRNQGKQV